MMKLLIVLLGLLVLNACSVDRTERITTGNNYFNEGRLQEALQAYQAAQVAEPDLPEAYYNAANTYGLLNEYDKAIAAYTQALKTSDTVLSSDIYFNLGNLYFQQKRLNSARDSYKQALLLNPNHYEARHNLELVLRMMAPPSSNITETPAADTVISTPTFSVTPTPVTDLDPTIEQTETLTFATLATAVNYPVTGTFSREDAIVLLDAVQRGQQQFPDIRLTTTPEAVADGNDW